MGHMGDDISSRPLRLLTGAEQRAIVSELVKRLTIEFRCRDRGGIYAMTQKEMAFNSNKIEGSTLTAEQTASLFDTGTLIGTEETVFRLRDIEEMSGHFAMFNEMLQTWDMPLTETLIKGYHYRFKAGVFEDMANGYPAGDYKNRANTVSDITTARPDQVRGLMSELLDGYNSIDSVDLRTLAWFHAELERIHPFQDGNGRVGRMVLFKECLKNGIIPVIIRDTEKGLYYHALNKAQNGHDLTYLTSLFEREQEAYHKILQGSLFDHDRQDDTAAAWPPGPEPACDMSNGHSSSGIGLSDDDLSL